MTRALAPLNAGTVRHAPPVQTTPAFWPPTKMFTSRLLTGFTISEPPMYADDLKSLS